MIAGGLGRRDEDRHQRHGDAARSRRRSRPWRCRSAGWRRSRPGRTPAGSRASHRVRRGARRRCAGRSISTCRMPSSSNGAPTRAKAEARVERLEPLLRGDADRLPGEPAAARGRGPRSSARARGRCRDRRPRGQHPADRRLGELPPGIDEAQVAREACGAAARRVPAEEVPGVRGRGRRRRGTRTAARRRTPAGARPAPRRDRRRRGRTDALHCQRIAAGVGTRGAAERHARHLSAARRAASSRRAAPRRRCRC